MLPLKNAGNIDVLLKLKVILTFTFLIRSGVWVSLSDILGSDCGTNSVDSLIFCSCVLLFSILHSYPSLTISLHLFLTYLIPLVASKHLNHHFFDVFPTFDFFSSQFHSILSSLFSSLLQHSDESFSVTPDELSLRVGEEQSIVVSFKAHGDRKYRERYTNTYCFYICLSSFICFCAVT